MKKPNSYLDLLKKRFSHLRKYTPTLLSTLEYKSTKSAEPLLKAIKNMNDTGKRKVPESVQEKEQQFIDLSVINS